MWSESRPGRMCVTIFGFIPYKFFLTMKQRTKIRLQNTSGLARWVVVSVAITGRAVTCEIFAGSGYVALVFYGFYPVFYLGSGRRAARCGGILYAGKALVFNRSVYR